MKLMLYIVLLSAIAFGSGVLRWRMARLYWHTHVGGSRGYLMDCLVLATPLLFLALGGAIGLVIAPRFGLGVFIILLPVFLAFTVALVVTPFFKRATVRIIRAHQPLEHNDVR